MCEITAVGFRGHIHNKEVPGVSAKAQRAPTRDGRGECWLLGAGVQRYQSTLRYLSAWGSSPPHLVGCHKQLFSPLMEVPIFSFGKHLLSLSPLECASNSSSRDELLT